MKLERSPQSGTNDHLWLNEDELLTICDYHEPCSDRWFGINLLARSGLKVFELIEIEREDIDVSEESVIHVPGSGRSPEPRRAPIPDSVAYAILALDVDGPIIDVADRTVRAWVNQMGEDLAMQHNNRNWESISPRHIRNSWVDNLLRDGIPPVTIMNWAGLSSYKQFQEIYMDRIQESIIQDERSKTDLF